MTIQVTYDGIEERDEATDAINVGEFRSFIWDFEQALRAKWKWGEWDSEETQKVIEELWETWHEGKANLPRGDRKSVV